MLENPKEESQSSIDVFFVLSEQNSQLEIRLEILRILGQNLIEVSNGLVALTKNNIEKGQLLQDPSLLRILLEELLVDLKGSLMIPEVNKNTSECLYDLNIIGLEGQTFLKEHNSLSEILG